MTEHLLGQQRPGPPANQTETEQRAFGSAPTTRPSGRFIEGINEKAQDAGGTVQKDGPLRHGPSVIAQEKCCGKNHDNRECDQHAEHLGRAGLTRAPSVWWPGGVPARHRAD